MEGVWKTSNDASLSGRISDCELLEPDNAFFEEATMSVRYLGPLYLNSSHICTFYSRKVWICYID